MKLFNKKTAPKSKAKVGGVKARSKVKVILVVVAIFSFASVAGTVGFYKWKDHDYKSKAAQWTYLTSQDNFNHTVSAWGCKTFIPAYGGVYQVKIMFSLWPGVGNNPDGIFAEAKSYRKGVEVAGSPWSFSWWNGTLTIVTVNASAFAGDTVKGIISAFNLEDSHVVFETNPKNLVNC